MKYVPQPKFSSAQDRPRQTDIRVLALVPVLFLWWD